VTAVLRQQAYRLITRMGGDIEGKRRVSRLAATMALRLFIRK